MVCCLLGEPILRTAYRRDGVCDWQKASFYLHNTPLIADSSKAAGCRETCTRL
jgi:hypothetical protein